VCEKQCNANSVRMPVSHVLLIQAYLSVFWTYKPYMANNISNEKGFCAACNWRSWCYLCPL